MEKNNTPLRFTKMPILLSALVYPGVGQFVQRRWFMALVYMGSFTALAGVVALLAFRYFKIDFKDLTYFQTDWLSHRTANPYREPLNKALIVWGAIFAANVFDTWWGFMRLRRARATPPPLKPT